MIRAKEFHVLPASDELSEVILRLEGVECLLAILRWPKSGCTLRSTFLREG